MDHECFRAVEAEDEELAAPLHRRDLAAFEQTDELLLVAMTADRTGAGHLDRLDLLADDLLVEVAAQPLAVRQLRHRRPPAPPPLLGDASTPPTRPPARPASSSALRLPRTGGRSRRRPRRNAWHDRAPRRAPHSAGVRGYG